MSIQEKPILTETELTTHYCILNSYNIITLEDPGNILTQSVSRAKSDLKPGEYVNVNNIIRNYKGEYKEVSSQFELRRDFSASVGISGHYGLYSADVNADYSTQYMQKSTSFNSRYKASIEYGNAIYHGTDPLNDLDTNLVNELRAISSHTEAKNFVDKYGTHLITQTGLGGLLYIGIQAKSESISTKESINASVSGAYNGAASSIEATAKVAIDIATKFRENQLTEMMTAIGGNPFTGPVDGENSSSELENWASSVTTDSVCTVLNSTPYWELVQGTAAVKLEEYVQSSLLIKSINKPSIFVSSKNLDDHLTTLSTRPDEGFKIISGGGEVDDSNCFILSTYPDTEGTDQVVQWTVDVHDCMIGYNPDKTMTTYAIAILDPFDLLDINVNSLDIFVREDGYGKAIPALGAVTGGGVRSEVNEEGKYKWMFGTNPRDEKHWHASVHNYIDESIDSNITVYALGVSCKNGLIDIQRHIAQNSVNHKQHPSQTTKLLAGKNLAGGGVWTVTETGDGVLTRKCAPTLDNSWASESSDTDGRVSEAYQTVWAIGLTAKGNW